MKKALLLSASCCIIYLSLTSASFGPGSQSLNGTGSPGSTTSCNNCHSGGAGTTTGTVELRKLSTGVNGPVVTTYNPDTVYIVKVVGNNASLSHFGFQLTALNSSDANAGTFQNVTGTMHIVPVGGKNIVEHTDQLAKTNNQYEASFQWKAPAAGTGTVTFYGVINGVDNTGGANNDKPGTPFTKGLTESAPVSVATVEPKAEIKAYPNPATNQLNISLRNAQKGNYTINVFDLNGRKILNKEVTANGSYETSLNTTNWSIGLYHVQLVSGDWKQTIAIMKQ